MFPRWLTWLFIFMMAYLVYSVGQSERHAATSPAVAPEAKAPSEAKKAVAEFTDVEAWKRKLDPDYAATHNCTTPETGEGLPFKILEEKLGEGEPAQCGETITIKLGVWGVNGTKTYTNEFPLAVGSHHLAAGLDAALPGIMPKGIRTILLPPVAVTRIKKSPMPAATLKALPENRLAIVTVERVK